MARVSALPNITKFHQYWDIYELIAEVSEIQGLFIRIDEDAGYCNIAIIGDGRIVDIEGDDGNGSGNTHIYSLRSVGEVLFYRGSLPSLRRSVGASLLMVTRIVGRDESGPYWGAKNPEEEELLVGFGQALVKAISSR
jgi:hypothetical protein